ncbi:MAG: hypothetical protein U1E32_03645, partial [Rhodoglobus sp.]|nr:hypothetical protein [Rhodoglobus sp.]
MMTAVAPEQRDRRITELADPTSGHDPHRVTGARRSPAQLALHVVLAGMAVFVLMPVILVISTTLKTPADVRVNPFGLFTSFSFQNIVDA